MKNFKRYLGSGLIFIITGLATFIIASKYPSNAYFILFIGGGLAEKLSSEVEGD